MKKLQKLLLMFLLPLVAGCLMSASCENGDDDEYDFTLFESKGELTIDGTRYYVGKALYYRSYFGGIEYEISLYESKNSLLPTEGLLIRDYLHRNISEYGSGITIDGYEGISVREFGGWPSGLRDCWNVISGKISVAPSGKDIKIQFHNLKFKYEDDKNITHVVNGTATAMLDGEM